MPSTFTVTSTLDDGSAGTLRWAIQQVDAGTGGDTVAFNLSINDPGYSFSTGKWTIMPSLLDGSGNVIPLPQITQSVQIDGWSQGGNSYHAVPLVIIDGSNVGGDGLDIAASNVQVDGLQFQNWTVGANILAGSSNDWVYGNVFTACFTTGLEVAGNNNLIGTNADGVNAAAECNLFGGIGNDTGANGVELDGNSNTVAGNYFGVTADGSQVWGNDGDILINGNDNTIGGATTAARNIISGSQNAPGITIQQGTGNEILGNYIGTDATGTTAIANDGDGVLISSGADRNTVNGNLISGNLGVGVDLISNNNVVQGNWIGTTAAGDAALSNTYGIFIYNSTGNQIGGSTAGSGNVITASRGYNVYLYANDNTVQGNLIGSDATGTIYLGPSIGTNPANADVDIHGGGNDVTGNLIQGGGKTGYGVYQNTLGNTIEGNRISGHVYGAIAGGTDLPAAPVLSDATTNTQTGVVTGTLTGAANTTYEVEFFSSTTASADGYEGATFLGSADVTTDGTGQAAISATLGALTGGAHITATATDSNGVTSIFSSDVTVRDVPLAANYTFVTNQNTPIFIDAAHGLLSNDSDADGDTLTVISTTSPAHDGPDEFQANADGSFDYEPAVGFYGTDSFSYTISDGHGDMATGYVTITVNFVEQPPRTVLHAYALVSNTTLNVAAAQGALSHDFDIDGDSLTAVLATGPSHGTLQLNSDGSFSYTPNAGYSGADSFTYDACDQHGNQVAGSVYLNVSPSANVFLVTSAGDDYLDWGSQGMPGTIRWAINQMNAKSGGTIDFDIGALDSAQTIQLETIDLPEIMAPVTIDGWSQGGAGYHGAPLITLDGAYLGDSVGLYIDASNVLVRGLTVANVAYVGDPNAGIGIAIGGGSNISIYGNDLVNDGIGIVLYGGANGNTISGNVISGNGAYTQPDQGSNPGLGSGLIVYSNNNIITGNRIGVDASGAADGNANAGIFLVGSGNVIGGTMAGTANIVVANSGSGIWLYGGAASNTVAGNYVGTDAAGDSGLGNGLDGVHVSYGASNNTIGAGNVIAFNQGAGVGVASDSPYGNTANDRITGNSIYGNGGLGIDLGDNGVTPNGSSTTGPNLGQNYPVLTSAITNGTTTTVTGTLTGAAKTAYRVEFFATPTADPSGHGQGQTYLGFGTVTTNAKGTASFTITLAGPIAPGQYITATATDPKGNTSEFAADVLDSSVELVPDAFNPKVTDLVVTSPSGNNTIVVSLAARGAGETVTINGVNRGTYKPTNAIEVYGMAGNDKITIQSQVTLPAYINGGSGNDTLQAGGGPSILYGGSGNDVLIGGTGRNILIGGTGTDTLDSGGTGSILVGGTTAYDGNLQALWAIMADWSQANVSYATRVAQLNGTQSGGLNGAYVLNTTTVQPSTTIDTLVGTNPALKTGALDWFFATSQDKVTRRRTAEVITPLP